MSKMTIGQLMNIDADRMGKASGCSVELVKTYHELKKANLIDRLRSFFGGKGIVNSYFVIFKLKVVGNSGKAYTVFIRTNPDFDLNKWESNPCKIYCSCPDFKFRSAYTLNRNGALFLNDRIRTELGAALTDKPKRTPSYLCKHAFAALNWLVQNYSRLMQTI